MANITTQQEFDEKYISSAEICDKLNIARSTLVHAKRAGHLPHSISVKSGRIFLWDRELITPYIEAWKLMLETRRGSKNAD